MLLFKTGARISEIHLHIGYLILFVISKIILSFAMIDISYEEIYEDTNS